jgi:hypothetical protein
MAWTVSASFRHGRSHSLVHLLRSPQLGLQTVKRIGREEAHKAQNIYIFARLVPFCGYPFAFPPAVSSKRHLTGFGRRTVHPREQYCDLSPHAKIDLPAVQLQKQSRFKHPAIFRADSFRRN